MKKDRFIAIRNQADTNTLELYFLDVIADTYDWYTGSSSKVQEIIDKVNYYKPSKILCVIDSIGGDAQIGMSIYNFLKHCDAKVEVEIIGLAGSIASVIAMAANKGKLRIAKNAFMIIHKAEGGLWGTSEDLRQGADLIDMYTNQIVDIYSQRSGKTVDEINSLIANGDYWMTGEDAVAQGFADETFNGVVNIQVAARLDDGLYKNIPAQIRAQIKPDDDHKSFIQQQFTEMKKFFTDIVNAIKGVKAVEGTPITNQIAEAVTAPFEKLAEELENTVTNKVNEVVASKPVNDAIAVQVNNAVLAIDFANEGPAKLALDAAVSLAVENATKDYKEKIEALEKAKSELEQDITNMKGKGSQSQRNEAEIIPVGKYN